MSHTTGFPVLEILIATRKEVDQSCQTLHCLAARFLLRCRTLV